MNIGKGVAAVVVLNCAFLISGVAFAQSSGGAAAGDVSPANGFPEKMSDLYKRMLSASGKGDVDNLKALVPQFNTLIAIDGKSASPACVKTAQARLELLKLTIDYNLADDEEADQMMKKIAVVDKRARELAAECPAASAAKPAAEAGPGLQTAPAASSSPAFAGKLNDLYRQTSTLVANTDVKGLKALALQLNELIAGEGKTASPVCIKTAQAQLSFVEAMIAYHSADDDDDDDDAPELMNKVAATQQEAMALAAACR